MFHSFLVDIGQVHLIRPPSKTLFPQSGALTNLEGGLRRGSYTEKEALKGVLKGVLEGGLIK